VRNALCWQLVFFLCLGTLNRVCAQQVLAPPPVEFAAKTNTIATLWGTNQFEQTAPEISPSGETTTRRLWDLGPVHLHPHMFYSLAYGNGLQSQPGNQSKSFINTLSPGMVVDIGSHWHFDYIPTLRYYSSREFRDSLDHSVSLTWGTICGDWKLGASQSYATSSEPLIETGSQTATETYFTVLSTAYQLNSKISLEFAANQGFRYANSISTNQPLTDSKTWTAIATANYELSPALSIGPNLTFAYDNLKVGSDMTSEQFQGQFLWRPGAKLTCLGRGGLEIRQFLDSTESDLLTPVFDFSLAYRLFEVTTFSLAASRTVTPSYFGNQLAKTYSFNGGMRQRLLEHLYLDVTGGYTTTTYRTTSAGPSFGRDDDYATMNIRLSCSFLQHGRASIFYNWSDNTSTQSGFGYNSDQVGLEFGYRF
jgi:hypothetical protein